ncbi:hypothetical protein MMC10_000705 [Thelotrema lepadinum]|nr:hypothetical protein [Thelotrema lepadinum]
MEPYRYELLGPDSFTRILQLHPSPDYDAPIRCDLQPWRADGLPYEAVSYSWESPILEETVFCGGLNHFIKIPCSLSTVLRALRKPSETRTLWADAICIDQINTSERAQQVRVMPQIYRKASRVIIYIEKDYDDGAKVLQFFSRYEREMITLDSYIMHGDKPYRKNDREEAVAAIDRMENGMNEIFVLTGIEPFRKIFQRPWFKRRWIIQEAVLAQEAHGQCGSISVKFSALAFGAAAMNLYCALQSGDHVLHPQFLMDDHISDMIDAIRSENRSKNWRGMTAPGPRFRLLGLLLRFHAAQCSNDRDRIYALVGLSDDIKPERDGAYDANPRPRYIPGRITMPITYESEIRDVYTQFAIRMLSRDYEYFSDVLHLAGAFRPPANEFTSAGLPSWTPDWRASRRFLPIHEPWLSVGPSSDGNGRHRWKIMNNGTELLLPGWKHSVLSEKLDAVCDFKRSSFEQLRATTQKWLKFYLNNRLRIPNGTESETNRLVEPEGWFHGFFRCVDMERKSGVDSEEFAELIFEGMLKKGPTRFDEEKGRLTDWIIEAEISNEGEELHSTLHKSRKRKQRQESMGNVPQSENLMWIRSCTKNLIELMKGRGLFRNQKGDVVNCPDDSEIGDFIAILYDVDTPFVLRPVPTSEAVGNNQQPHRRVLRSQSYQGEKYRIVGDCFVQGMMDYRRADGPGDGLAKEKCGEAKTFVIA